MIQQQWLDSLDDPDPEVRKQAVKAIVNSGDEDAMTYLAKVYRTDSDPEVKEMARQGGIKLREMGFSVRRSEPEPRSIREEEDEYDPMAGLYATPLREEAPRKREEIPSYSTPQKPQRDTSSSSPLSWAGISPDLFLYFVIVAVGTFILTTVLAQSLEPLLEDAYAAATPQESQQLQDIFEQSTSGLVFSSAIAGILAVVTLIIQVWLIHYLATSSFGGDGNMFAFIRKYAIANAILTVVVFGLSAALLATIFGAMPDFATTGATTTTTPVSSEFESLFLTLCCGILIGIIGVFWYFGRMISRHYYIGMWQAIGAFIVGLIASQILTQILSSLIT